MDRPEYQSERFAAGLKVRREVLGAAHVDASLARADDFTAAFQQLATEHAWADIWTRPGLDRRSRSLLTVAMLIALGRFPELKLHVRGALNNGLTRDELREVLLQTGVYCGIPACLEAFKAAAETLAEIDAETPASAAPAGRAQGSAA